MQWHAIDYLIDSTLEVVDDYGGVAVGERPNDLLDEW